MKGGKKSLISTFIHRLKYTYKYIGAKLVQTHSFDLRGTCSKATFPKMRGCSNSDGSFLTHQTFFHPSENIYKPGPRQLRGVISDLSLGLAGFPNLTWPIAIKSHGEKRGGRRQKWRVNIYKWYICEMKTGASYINALEHM